MVTVNQLDRIDCISKAVRACEFVRACAVTMVFSKGQPADLW